MILRDLYNEKISEQENKTSTKGNLLEDIPQMYKRDGAINILKSLRSGLDELEQEVNKTK